MMKHSYKIATYNIRNTQDQYALRRTRLREVIQGLDCDIIGLQEVAQPELEYLSGDYQIFFAGIQRPFPFHKDPEFRLDGNAILVKKDIKVIEHEFVHLSIFRNVQRIRIGDNIDILNTHLHHVIGEDQIRDHQIDCIRTYLIPFMQNNIVIMGDFNMTPDSKEYQKMSDNFISSYKQLHKIEPKLTFPTGLQGPFMDTDPEGTFDYIWISNKWEVKEAQLFGGEKIQDGVYASDHLGVSIKLEL